jgi:predicted secreted protein
MFTAFVLFVLIWWTVLFAVLPFWTRPAADADADTGWRGAPVNPRMARKLLVTTLVALVIWVSCESVIQSGLLSFRQGILALPDD